MFRADMVLKLAGRGYEHAAGAIFVCRVERKFEVEDGLEDEVCAPLAGRPQVAQGLQWMHTV
jgi:hypothetical protein